MAWGQIHAFHRDESLPGVNTHVWEYLRASGGLDLVIGEHRSGLVPARPRQQP